MTATSARQPIWLWAVMAIGIGGSIVIAALFVSSANTNEMRARTAMKAGPRQAEPPRLGVHAKITAGEIAAERSLPAMAFALSPGQSLDARIPAGPFEAEFTVTFRAGDVRYARLGAKLQGGSVIAMRAGRVLFSDSAEAEAKVVLSPAPIAMGRRAHQVIYIFKTDGVKPVSFTALWQPEDSQVPLPLPSDGAPLLDQPELRGMSLAQQFNCVACHAGGSPSAQANLSNNPAPLLGGIGQRVRPQWIRQWIADPQLLLPGTAMPRMFHGGESDAEHIENLTHFLVSMGGPIDDSDAALDPDLVNTGMLAYHTIGCFACHGPLEALENFPGGLRSTAQPLQAYVPLGDLPLKTTAARLAAFLMDPINHRPSGRMPAQNLSRFEAHAISSYLLDRLQRDEGAKQYAPFVLDPQRIDHGRALFAKIGCANCHEIGSQYAEVEAALTAAPLDSLGQQGSSSGCLSLTPMSSAPDFALDDSHRAAVSTFLESLPQRACENIPHDELALQMARLNCTACHAFHGERGPERAIAQYFNTILEADLGDEGRIPPNLSHAGSRLNPLWMHEVLTEGGQARPYMGARMPQYGQHNVSELAALLSAAAGTWPQPDHGPSLPREHAAIGRELVGSQGFNCIQCHTTAGRDATGTPGPDLAHMAERLRFGWFTQWLHDPKLMRPGTRMPTFFVGGRSGFEKHLDGDAHRQVDAMWSYLSLGEQMPMPQGLVEPRSLVLQVKDEPIVLRTFMQDAGVRAIACGFPEQIHCAFDAEKCRLAMIWEGEFINAAGAWAARGGTQTNPAKIVWRAPDEPLVRITSGGHSAEGAELRFKGYRLDETRRPIFMYDAAYGGVTIRITEQPIPSRESGKARMIRRFTVETPPGLSVDVLGRSVTIDEEGRGEIDVEVTW